MLGVGAVSGDGVRGVGKASSLTFLVVPQLCGCCVKRTFVVWFWVLKIQTLITALNQEISGTDQECTRKMTLSNRA